MTCRVLKLARQPYYRWLANPITDAEVVEAYRANALFDAHENDPEFGYRYLVEEAREAGETMAERTAWRICSQNRCGVCSARSAAKNGKVGTPVHDDLVEREFTADAPNRLCSAISLSIAPMRETLSLRDQGRVLQPHRRVLDRLPDEVPVGHHSAQ